MLGKFKREISPGITNARERGKQKKKESEFRRNGGKVPHVFLRVDGAFAPFADMLGLT